MFCVAVDCALEKRKGNSAGPGLAIALGFVLILSISLVHDVATTMPVSSTSEMILQEKRLRNFFIISIDLLFIILSECQPQVTPQASCVREGPVDNTLLIIAVANTHFRVERHFALPYSGNVQYGTSAINEEHISRDKRDARCLDNEIGGNRNVVTE